MRSHKKHYRKRKRTKQGIYLVEILVAISIGAMLTLALLNTASMSLRHATTTQNEVYANTIVRELIESTRATGYNSLVANIGDYTLLTNRISSGETGPFLREEPLQIDAVTKSWEQSTQNGRFRGDVKYKIEKGPDPDTTVKVTVTVSWLDSTWSDESKGKRSVSSSTVVSESGTNAWSPF